MGETICISCDDAAKFVAAARKIRDGLDDFLIAARLPWKGQRVILAKIALPLPRLPGRSTKIWL